MDLPETDAFLEACRRHGALAGVRLAIAGTQGLITWRAGLRQSKKEGPTGDSLHPAHCVQTVLIVFTRICGEISTCEYVLQYGKACSTV